jgi:hypothetical protein
MTTIRTDLIPNLYANPIRTVSKASTAVVTVPVIATVVSTTGTIGTVTGSGTTLAPWTATVTLMSSVVGLQSGDVITATAGTGTFAAGGSVSVAAILGNQSIQINKVGGTIPTAGTVTNITEPAMSTLPVFLVNGDPILFTNPGNRFTFSSSTGTFQAGETFSQATSGATGLVTNVFPTVIEYTATSGVVDLTHVVTGDTSGATTTPTAVTGMNQLLTAGINGTNQFFVKKLTSTTFELYTDAALTVPVASTLYTTYTTNAGQYTVTDTVLITTP